MDEPNKDQKLELSPEEQKAEEEATKEVNDDELRSKLAEDLGINPEEQADLLNKMVEREKLNRQRLSGAIKQKITWREKAQKQLPNQTKGDARGGDTSQQPDLDKLVDQKLNERLDARELVSLGFSDDLQAEVKDLARLKGISVRDAAQLPYIQSRKAEAEKAARIVSATPKRSNNGKYTVSYDPAKPLDINDFKTPDGKIDTEAWKEAKAARAKHRSQQQ